MNEFVDALRGSIPILVTCCTLLGLLVGSFLNVVIHRLPVMMQREWEAQCADLAGAPAPAQERTTSCCRGPAARSAGTASLPSRISRS